MAFANSNGMDFYPLQETDVRVSTDWCTCAAPLPHAHGPCRLCVFYATHRPGDPAWQHRLTCLHPTMQEVRESPEGQRTVYGDILVRNGGGRCPTFQPQRFVPTPEVLG